MILFTHPAMLDHHVPAGHAERPARLEAVLRGLEGLPIKRREAAHADRADIERVHSSAYIDAIERSFPEDGALMALDPDTFLSVGSREAVWRAAGACVMAVDAVMSGETLTAFCAVRPPGHHAEPDRAMGFCVFNNVAVGALHALEAHNLERVAAIDFDVHHGNGTQTVAETEPRLFFASTHQSPLYPGTGREDETGVDGNVLNVVLPPGAGGVAWRHAMERHVLPGLDAFQPQLILISAGFDAHAADPLANLELTADDYAWGTRAIRELATRHASGRIVSTLEGGYDLDALAQSARAHVQALM
jgi:acetoin utilization deacetylase AcuC-like enzyme